MAQPTLLIAGTVALAVAGAYGYVASQLGRRPVPNVDARRALRSFALWWGALAANLVIVSFVYFAAGLGWLTLPVQLADSILQRLLLAISMIGLVDYLLFVITGKHRYALIVTAYAFYVAWAISIMFYAQPTDVLIGRWRTDLVYARSGPAWAPLVSLAFILGPAIVGALAYLRLCFRVEDRSQRYRIAVVAGSLLIWWVVAVAAGHRALLDNDALQLGQRFLGLVTAFAVLAAFRPPAWIRTKWGIESFGATPT